MQNSTTEFRNILVIDLGQLGDVVLSLPALVAVREKFASAKITVMAGKPATELIAISGFADEIVEIDRRNLRQSSVFKSVPKLLRLAADIRRRRFDLVIDLHSLYETNILGFLSRAPHRLYANRENRSLDFLANFQERPPLEDKSLHLVDRYLDVLRPLGITDGKRQVKLAPSTQSLAEISELLPPKNGRKEVLVGLFLGAGHPDRMWSTAKFGELAEKLKRHDDIRLIAFLGPEEHSIRDEAYDRLSGSATLIEGLSLASFFAALSMLDLLVCGDTGPMHLAGLTGIPLVILLEKMAPLTYLPLTEKRRVIIGETVNVIEVENVYASVTELMKENSQKHE